MVHGTKYEYLVNIVVEIVPIFLLLVLHSFSLSSVVIHIIALYSRFSKLPTICSETRDDNKDNDENIKQSGTKKSHGRDMLILQQNGTEIIIGQVRAIQFDRWDFFRFSVSNLAAVILRYSIRTSDWLFKTIFW